MSLAPGSSSNSITYEKPEQPPPRTPRRSIADGVPRFSSASFAFTIALDVTCTCIVVSRVLTLRSAAIRLLLAIVFDGALDGIFGEHRAVDLHRRKTELFDDVGVLD